MLSIVIGFVLSFVVRWASKIPFVKQNPKVIVGILGAIASVIAVVCLHCATVLDALKQLQDQIGQLAVGAITAYSVGVATHETIIKPSAGPMNAGNELPVGVKVPPLSSPLQGGR
jgi:hypothetical protein